jgi:hypothetical protein
MQYPEAKGKNIDLYNCENCIEMYPLSNNVYTKGKLLHAHLKQWGNT